MPDWAKSARKEATTTVVSPLTKRDFVIRKLTSSELLEAGLSPLIHEKKPEKFENDIAATAWVVARADVSVIAQSRAVITRGVVDPPIVYGDEENLPEGTVHARWISEDETWLQLTILAFSGLADEGHRQKMATILKNENGSATSLPSVDISESSPANC